MNCLNAKIYKIYDRRNDYEFPPKMSDSVPLMNKSWRLCPSAPYFSFRNQNLILYDEALMMRSYRCVMPTDGIQSLRRNYVSPSCPYLGIMPWRSLEARAPSCRPWPLYLAKMWPREQTKVIAADLASRRRTTAVLSSLSTSVSVALLTLKMYRHSVSIFFLLI